jgi:NADPH-dependent 2,4-dienoyl-CoA reductase/sulfur reductase-like enzyme
MDKIVIVGASLAGLRAAESLRAEGFDGRITFVDAEPHRPYNRPPLSKGLLAGTTARADLEFRGADAVGAEWRLGVEARSLDVGRRRVTLSDGTQLGFDGVVVACGSIARWPAWLDRPDGAFALRTVDDAAELSTVMRDRRRVVVVGAGFIGCEVAATARGLGLDVTLVDVAPLPLHAALGDQLAGVCADLHRDHGVRLRLGTRVAAFEQTAGRLSGVRLDDGTLIPADVACVGLGAEPATRWLEGSGLPLDDGVSDVVAAGDVASWPHPLFGGQRMRVEHWTHAARSGMHAAQSLLAGANAEPYAALPEFWSDQFGVKIQGVGLPRLGRICTIVDGSVAERAFVAVYERDGATVGAVAFNATRKLARWRGVIGLPLAPATR